MSDWYKWDGEDLIITVRAQPNSSKDIITPPENDIVKVKIKAPPVDGKANSHLIKFLSKSFGTPKSKIVILNGETSKSKRIKIPSPKKIPGVLSEIRLSEALDNKK